MWPTRRTLRREVASVFLTEARNGRQRTDCGLVPLAELSVAEWLARREPTYSAVPMQPTTSHKGFPCWPEAYKRVPCGHEISVTSAPALRAFAPGRIPFRAPSPSGVRRRPGRACGPAR